MIRTHNGVECAYECNHHAKGVIYLLTFPTGKMYIGQTSKRLNVRIKEHCTDAFNNRNYRWDNPKNRAIRKYKKFTVSIIATCATIDELNNKEDELITDYKNKGFKLYNVASGGLNNCEYFGVKCVVTDQRFNLIKTFDKVKEAREYLSAKGKTSTRKHYYLIKGKYFLLHEDVYKEKDPKDHIKDYQNQIREKKQNIKEPIRKEKVHYNVVQIDHRYNAVSIMDICEAEKICTQIRCYINRHVLGFYWMREDVYNGMLKENKPLNTVLNGLRYIYQVDRRGNIMREANKATQMSVLTGDRPDIISNSARSRVFRSSEYFYMYSDEYIYLTPEEAKERTTLEQTYEPKAIEATCIATGETSIYESINLCALNLCSDKQAVRNCARRSGIHKGFRLKMRQ